MTRRHVFRTCKSNRPVKARKKDCGCGCGGSCSGGKRHRGTGFFVQLAKGEFRFENFEGKKHLVVPVVMARSDVPMNGGLVPQEELVPFAWNGVPVTVGHPEANGMSIEANSPQILQEWAVGRIFNAILDGEKLRAEAWIDMKKAEKVRPGLIKMLQTGAKVDVSTGYFCDAEPSAGRVNGKAYQELHRNLKPEHLALLPDDVGACSFEDGCGVRLNSNLRKEIAMKLNTALKAFREATEALEKSVSKLALNSAAPSKSKRVQTKAKGTKAKTKKNERGDDDDARQMVADLISSDDTPFLPDDEDSLRMMSFDTLKKMRDKFLGAEDDEEETETAEEDEETETAEEDEETETNEDEDTDDAETAEDDDEEEHPAMRKRKNSADAGLAAEVAKLTKLVAKLATNGGLSAEDREALRAAKKEQEERKEQLIQHIVANTKLPEKKVRGFDYATLETLAGGILPVANFAGRAVPKKENKEKDAAVEAMTEFTGNNAVVRVLNEQRKKAS